MYVSDQFWGGWVGGWKHEESLSTPLPPPPPPPPPPPFPINLYYRTYVAHLGVEEDGAELGKVGGVCGWVGEKEVV